MGEGPSAATAAADCEEKVVPGEEVVSGGMLRAGIQEMHAFRMPAAADVGPAAAGEVARLVFQLPHHSRGTGEHAQPLRPQRHKQLDYVRQPVTALRS